MSLSLWLYLWPSDTKKLSPYILCFGARLLCIKARPAHEATCPRATLLTREYLRSEKNKALILISPTIPRKNKTSLHLYHLTPTLFTLTLTTAHLIHNTHKQNNTNVVIEGSRVFFGRKKSRDPSITYPRFCSKVLYHKVFRVVVALYCHFYALASVVRTGLLWG